MRRQIARRIAQALSSLVHNAYLPGFVRGDIYKGPIKHVCVPGLNCYSCPGAVGACPAGSLQNALGGGRRFSFLFVAGTILLYGILMGRWICGWLCPFGLLQEGIHKIPSPKVNVPGRLKSLRYLPYAILAVLVVLLPAMLLNRYGMGTPWFCKLACPAGTLTGALPLMAADPALADAAGALFALKLSIMVMTVAGCLFIWRFFCRFMCPLGALYGLFNRVSLYRYRFDPGRCTSCGACRTACPMGLDPSAEPNAFACVRCGKCLDACVTGALSRERRRSCSTCA